MHERPQSHPTKRGFSVSAGCPPRHPAGKWEAFPSQINYRTSLSFAQHFPVSAGCPLRHPAAVRSISYTTLPLNKWNSSLSFSMSVRKAIPEKDGLYLITITCAQWLWLFEKTNSFDIVYNWFDYLKSKGHLICGYVIMPQSFAFAYRFPEFRQKD